MDLNALLLSEKIEKIFLLRLDTANFIPGGDGAPHFLTESPLGNLANNQPKPSIYHSSCKYVSSHFNLAARGCHGFIILGMPSPHYEKKLIWLMRAF